MVEAKEVKVEVEIFRKRKPKKEASLIERAIATDDLPKEITGEPLKYAIDERTPIDRMRKGSLIHVPSNYMALLYTEEKEGIIRVHGVYGYSEPEAPHKIEELPELKSKGLIRKTYSLKVVYIKTDREDFGISPHPKRVYSSRFYTLSVLTTDLIPVNYRVFRFEVQVLDAAAFVSKLSAKRITLTYRKVKEYLLYEFHWIVDEILSKYDLLSAIKDKLQIQKKVMDKFSKVVGNISLELLGFVWDYDIDTDIRDRYFWLHVQEVSPPDVLRMETLRDMAGKLAKSQTTAGAGARATVELASQR
ncbi:MAG: hypothetical protein PVF15_03800 [Candidatus Bathyarchaeota archaeon]|jgi:hypothetical protein